MFSNTKKIIIDVIAYSSFIVVFILSITIRERIIPSYLFLSNIYTNWNKSPVEGLYATNNTCSSSNVNNSQNNNSNENNTSKEVLLYSGYQLNCDLDIRTDYTEYVNYNTPQSYINLGKEYEINENVCYINYNNTGLIATENNKKPNNRSNYLKNIPRYNYDLAEYQTFRKNLENSEVIMNKNIIDIEYFRFKENSNCERYNSCGIIDTLGSIICLDHCPVNYVDIVSKQDFFKNRYYNKPTYEDDNYKITSIVHLSNYEALISGYYKNISNTRKSRNIEMLVDINILKFGETPIFNCNKHINSNKNESSNSNTTTSNKSSRLKKAILDNYISSSSLLFNQHYSNQQSAYIIDSQPYIGWSDYCLSTKNLAPSKLLLFISDFFLLDYYSNKIHITISVIFTINLGIIVVAKQLLIDNYYYMTKYYVLFVSNLVLVFIIINGLMWSISRTWYVSYWLEDKENISICSDEYNNNRIYLAIENVNTMLWGYSVIFFLLNICWFIPLYVIIYNDTNKKFEDN